MSEQPAPAHWEPGDEVVLRYITRLDGRVGMSWPFRVVRDDDDLVALYLPHGGTFMRWHTSPAGGRELIEGEWRRDLLRLMYPGKGYSIWLFWEGDDRLFTTYYVNFEEPFRRTSIGFDTNDHTLDIVVKPNFHWSWKDEADFEATIQSGTFSAELGQSVRDAAASVVSAIETHGHPFDDPWPSWSPPADWSMPHLNPRWREEPPALWPQHNWAYPLSTASPDNGRG
ncbi:MAG: DUF402 domain-containing protein [Tepidiformaceae bacterium]